MKKREKIKQNIGLPTELLDTASKGDFLSKYSIFSCLFTFLSAVCLLFVSCLLTF